MNGGGDESIGDEEIIQRVKTYISEGNGGDHAGGQFKAQQTRGNQRSHDESHGGDDRGGGVQVTGAHSRQESAGKQTQQRKFKESVRRRYCSGGIGVHNLILSPGRLLS